MSLKTGMCEATSELDDECYYVKDDENDEICSWPADSSLPIHTKKESCEQQ